MNESTSAYRRLDPYAFEMILALALITLHDFLLSDALSLPLALQRSALAEFRALDRVVSGAEFIVPIVVVAIMLIMWLTRHNTWVRYVAIVFLSWVTLRLIVKVALVLFTIVARPPKQATGLLTDTIVLWFVIFLIFGVWYWIVDGGGPRARRDGAVMRFDFSFPQRVALHKGWTNWQPGFWDYVYLGFNSSTQFGSGDANVLSLRAKLLVMILVTLSIAVIVFFASIAIGFIR